MSATTENIADHPDGVTRVDLAELIALRARAGKARAVAARVRHAAAGGHVSALRGRGMEYAESRAYQPGDDARNIDWRRTARSGKWHTKLFEAEREQSLLLVMDTHPTMRFGTRQRYKSVAAARAAAWLAWTCARGGDRVGALAFGPVRAALDPRGGTSGVLGTLGALARWDAASAAAGNVTPEPLSAAVARARRLTLPGSRMWLFSDGWCVDPAAGAALARTAQHVDLRVVIVADPLELDLVPAGAYAFEAGAARRALALHGVAEREQFRDSLARGVRELGGACAGVQVPCAILRTTDEPDVALRELWRAGGGGR
ncbi:MAG TPA: DUF58 domain-containing protein [Rhodanobacteraceae bacterium]